jgi:hypothetical protein
VTTPWLSASPPTTMAQPSKRSTREGLERRPSAPTSFLT